MHGFGAKLKDWPYHWYFHGFGAKIKELVLSFVTYLFWCKIQGLVLNLILYFLTSMVLAHKSKDCMVLSFGTSTILVQKNQRLVFIICDFHGMEEKSKDILALSFGTSMVLVQN